MTTTSTIDLRPAPTTTPAAVRRRRRPPLEVVGVALAIVAFLVAGASFALQVPAFYGTDERAHLGYAHALADGGLPAIEDRPDIPVAATEWRAEVVGDSRDDSYRTIWVANHPPLHYAIVTPLVWLAESTGRDDGGLLLLRLANLALGSVAIAFTYLLTVELTGGSRRLGLAAAAILALLPRGHFELAQALNDGLALTAATALVWAAARLLRRDTTTGGLALLGATAAVAAGARAATMLVAVAVVATVAVVRPVATQGPRRARVRAAALTLAFGLGPAAVLWGWFYARNVVRYGDLGASGYLMERFERDQEGFLAVLTRWDLWVDLYEVLPTRSVLSAPASSVAVGVAIVVGIVAAAGVLRATWAGRVRRPALALCVVAGLVVVVTVTQHIAGGGTVSSRYVFPALGVMAALAAVGLAAVHRVLAVLAVAALAVGTAHVLPGRVAAAIERSGRTQAVDLGWPLTVGLLSVGTAATAGLLAVLVVSTLRPAR